MLISYPFPFQQKNNVLERYGSLFVVLYDDDDNNNTILNDILITSEMLYNNKLYWAYFLF